MATPRHGTDADTHYRTIDEFTLGELEAIRLLLRGGSVIDWHRLNVSSDREAHELIAAHELRLSDPQDVERINMVRDEAIAFLRRHFDFPVPKPVAQLDLPGLMHLAAAAGHRQLCACAILKVMHIIHHLEGRELLFMLPFSDQELFYLVEEKVYRVVGGMLANEFPILEFIGGRKNKDSLYQKLLSKPETIAANIYDKLRFRIVTREPDDIFPTLNHMLRHIFPFNYVIPGQSTNTLFHFRSYCEKHPHLSGLFGNLQTKPDLEDNLTRLENRFSATNYSVVHFVVDMPLRVPPEMLKRAPAQAHNLGPVIFVLTEFQILDRHTEQRNELGDASHAAYKERQKRAVALRLKVGTNTETHSGPPPKKPPPSTP
ncbi:MAG: hypothetical protein RL701_6234 [Pseudomonadota bacterium]|jgi:uncharacterized protein (TIGR04552 family)